MKSKKMIVNILFFAVMIILFIILHKSTSDSEKNRHNHGEFSIGFFIKYSPSGPGTSGGCRYYFYDGNGSRRSSMQHRDQPAQSEIKKIKEGDQYLVLYNDDGSDMLFDYPIKDSADFEKYVKEFTERRENNQE